MEATQVNDRRFQALLLLIALAYAWATWHRQRLRQLRLDHYAGRIQEHQDKTWRQSYFSLGLYGQRWLYGMGLWATHLMVLKPHQRLYFQRGLHALSLMQQAL